MKLKINKWEFYIKIILNYTIFKLKLKTNRDTVVLAVTGCNFFTQNEI